LCKAIRTEFKIVDLDEALKTPPSVKKAIIGAAAAAGRVWRFLVSPVQFLKHTNHIAIYILICYYGKSIPCQFLCHFALGRRRRSEQSGGIQKHLIKSIPNHPVR
jgi:hypothetical protein